MMSARIYRSYGIELVRHNVFHPLNKDVLSVYQLECLWQWGMNLYDGVLLILDLP